MLRPIKKAFLWFSSNNSLIRFFADARNAAAPPRPILFDGISLMEFRKNVFQKKKKLGEPKLKVPGTLAPDHEQNPHHFAKTSFGAG